MLNEIIKGFKEGEENKEVKVLVLTGQGSYYCAGVDLSKTFKFDHPQKMWEMINKQNQMRKY